MYKLGTIIGLGTSAIIFKIRGKSRLIARILLDDDFKHQLNVLDLELNRGKLLRKLGVPVPKFISIVSLEIPDHFDETFKRFKKRPYDGSYIGINPSNYAGKKVPALIMEFIEDDLLYLGERGDVRTVIGDKRLEYIRKRETAKLFTMGIRVEDSDGCHNVLWCQRTAKFYFIDFEDWEFDNPLKMDHYPSNEEMAKLYPDRFSYDPNK